MRKLNSLQINKKTMNSGYIFVKDSRKAKQLKVLFDDMKIEYVVFIHSDKDFRVFGFKIYRIKKQFFELCSALGEVI